MKVSIIGAGNVGSEIANYLLLKGNIEEIALINRTYEKAEAEVMDLRHMLPFYSTNTKQIYAGRFEDLKDSDIVVNTAGAPLSSTIKTKADLIKANIPIIDDLAVQVKKYAPDCIFIMVANPVDTFAYRFQQKTGFPSNRIMSSGTINDTARLKDILQGYLNLPLEQIDAVVYGEHSAQNFIPWSKCRIAGQDIDTYCSDKGIPPVNKDEIATRVNSVGYEILARKKFTNHGIAAGACRIIDAIANDEDVELPVGRNPERAYSLNKLIIGLPVLVNRNGGDKVIETDFASDEIKMLYKSAESIHAAIDSI